MFCLVETVTDLQRPRWAEDAADLVTAECHMLIYIHKEMSVKTWFRCGYLPLKLNYFRAEALKLKYNDITGGWIFISV